MSMPIQSGSSVVPPSAAKLARGVDGKNLDDVASRLAQDSATVTGTLKQKSVTHMAADLATLRSRLAQKLSQQQLQNVLMVAGALLSGPNGVVPLTLAETLHQTLVSKDGLQKLAHGIQHFDDRKSGQPPLNAFDSLHNRVLSNLISSQAGSVNVPVAMFLSGALANSYQDRGGLEENLPR